MCDILGLAALPLHEIGCIAASQSGKFPDSEVLDWGEMDDREAGPALMTEFIVMGHCMWYNERLAGVLCLSF
jgi:hypothetical protein